MNGVQSILAEHRQVWAAKPALRLLYQDWYRRMLSHLAASNKPILELGGGSGNLKEFRPEVISTDIAWCEWLDAVFDAHHAPFRDSCIGNIVMFDVLHHLAAPRLFFKEAARMLEPGGRIIMLEPYISPISWIVYSLFHQEEVRCDVHPLESVGAEGLRKDPFEGNGAIPSLIFWKHREEMAKIFPQLQVVVEDRLSFWAYPLSGGFKSWSLLPSSLALPLTRLEEKCERLGSLLAFRCLVVLEKRH